MRDELAQVLKELTALRSHAAESPRACGAIPIFLLEAHHAICETLNRVVLLLTATARTPPPAPNVPAQSSRLPILRIADVARTVGLSRSTLWRMLKNGQFPQPRHVSAHAVGWLEQEVEDWVMRRGVAAPEGRCFDNRLDNRQQDGLTFLPVCALF